MSNLHITLYIILGQYTCIIRTYVKLSLVSVVKTNFQTKRSMKNYYGLIDKTDLIIIGIKQQRDKVIDNFPVSSIS